MHLVNVSLDYRAFLIAWYWCGSNAVWFTKSEKHQKVCRWISSEKFVSTLFYLYPWT